jgi:hypothetical protein
MAKVCSNIHDFACLCEMTATLHVEDAYPALSADCLEFLLGCA